MSKAIINKKKYIWSLIFNLVIFVFMITGLFIGIFIEKWKWSILVYFTIQSNILMGIISLVFSVFACLVLSKKIKTIPKPMEIIKLLGTMGVVLTFLTVICFLGPTSKWNPMMFSNSNAFYHVIIPIVSLLTFILFEHSDNKYFYPETFYGLIHVFIYSIFYLCVGLTHIKDGKVPSQYDWYGFFNIFGIKWCWACIIMMLGVAYLITWLLWLANKKIHIFDKANKN